MDLYDAALKRLRADTRSPAELGKGMKLPAGTVRDIKKGICDNPRLKTVRRVVKFYFPSAALAA